jgi:predicted PurR-regulated permease PerM
MTDTAEAPEAPNGSALERWGRASWMLIGVLALATIVYTALATLSGLVIPLVIATVIGMLFVPVVDALERRRVPRMVGAAVVMLGITATVIGSIAIAVNGLIDQADEINRSLVAGLESVHSWFDNLDLDLGVSEQRIDQAKQFGIDLIPGVASWFTSAFSSVIAFLAGSFLGLFLLYFILADWARLRLWVGGHIGVAPQLGDAIVDDTTSIIRKGFAALTVSSLVTAIMIGLTMVILDLPLAFTVALVTFVTSYIPYLGAIFSAMFACLVALGSGSPTQAFVLLIVILVAQNVVQTVVTTKLTSDQLALHPIASLISTIVGASLAGLLGATLSAPVLASVIRITQRVREQSVATDQLSEGTTATATEP